MEYIIEKVRQRDIIMQERRQLRAKEYYRGEKKRRKNWNHFTKMLLLQKRRG